MTSIWLSCVMVAWLSAAGDVAGYHTQLGGQLGPDVPATQSEVCVESKYTPTSFRVQAFDAAGNVSPWSEPLELERVHHFDSTGDGTAGINDFGRLIRDFGIHYRANGIASRGG